jgi:hypothetical protein
VAVFSAMLSPLFATGTASGILYLIGFVALGVGLYYRGVIPAGIFRD